jgi:hypothetical protein
MQAGKQATGSHVLWSAAKVYPDWQLHRKLPKVLMQKCEQRVSHGSTEHSSTSATLGQKQHIIIVKLGIFGTIKTLAKVEFYDFRVYFK